MPKASPGLFRGVVSASGWRGVYRAKLLQGIPQSRSRLGAEQHLWHCSTPPPSSRQFTSDTSHNFLSTRSNNIAEHSNNDASNQETPAPEGALSIVFTDIVQSTQMWESNPPAMAAAMQTHDHTIRSQIAVYNGYEVKQNGDGFMIAFPTAVSALQFCLDVQQRLLDQKWPDELLKLSPAKVARDEQHDGKPLFRGLRLRMSAHWGEPVCVFNEVIGRMDYLGPTVNRAARFIQVAEGGQIVVSEDFLKEIRNASRKGKVEMSGEEEGGVDLDVLRGHGGGDGDGKGDNQFEIRLLGKHEFKGLADSQKLYFIVPRSLHGRLEYWPKHRYVQGSKGNIVEGSG